MQLKQLFRPRTLLFSVGVLGLVFAAFNATRFFAASAPAAADFTCPADTECPYDSNGTFVGYKKPWPPGCVYIIPGLPASESGKQTNTGNLKWNQADRNGTTTAPQCYPEDVSAFGFSYYGRGHRMFNVGTYVDKNGYASKFNAGGSFIGQVCEVPEKCGSLVGSSSSQVDTSVAQTGMQTSPGATNATEVNNEMGRSFPLAVGTTFKYTSNDAIYYLDNGNCKKRYASWDMVDAWKIDRGSIVTVWDSMQYPDCASPLVEPPVVSK